MNETESPYRQILQKLRSMNYRVEERDYCLYAYNVPSLGDVVIYKDGRMDRQIFAAKTSGFRSRTFESHAKFLDWLDSSKQL